MKQIQSAAKWAARRNPAVWLWWGAAGLCMGLFTLLCARTALNYQFTPKATVSGWHLVNANGKTVARPDGL